MPTSRRSESAGRSTAGIARGSTRSALTRMILSLIRIEPWPLSLVITIALPFLLLSGCAGFGPSKEWQADGFDARTRIMLAQIGLRSEGFDTGSVDGQDGLRTRAAAAAFRRSIGVPASDRVDGKLIKTIFQDHDFDKPMPYIEGSIRNCFRWGPNRVVIMASNLGTLTCTVGAGSEVDPNEIDMAAEFCVKSVRLLSDAVRCELIFDGRRIVNYFRLAQMLNDPVPDVPVVIRSYELVENIDSMSKATLRSEAPLFHFHQSVFNLKPPIVLQKPLQARIIGMRGRTICKGTVTPIDPILTRYAMTCFRDTPIKGEARFVGVVPLGEFLLPAYETTAEYSSLRMSLIPPSNTIRFDTQTP